MFRTLTPRQWAFDVVLAASCLLLRLVIGIGGPALFLVLLAMAAALALRRASPALALSIAWFGAIVQLAAGLHPDVCNLAILPVLYATAAYGVPVVKWLGLASSGAGALVIALYLSLRNVLVSSLCVVRYEGFCPSGPQPSNWALVLVITFFSALAVFVLSWTLGLLAKTWGRAREGSRARAIAERQRIDAQKEVVVEQERNRIARDMHDVVAHSLAVVIAQADGARYARVSDPEAVDAALTTIAGTAREALGDVRILLGQLRHSQQASPQPVLADLDRLIEQLRSSGLRVVVARQGEVLTLAAGQQLAIFRIVQEALTNALRHGDVAEEVNVDFRWSAEDVVLSVSNRIPAAMSAPDVSEEGSAGTPGHGLAGMRERAMLWGGDFSAGPSGDGGYLVWAALPIRAERDS